MGLANVYELMIRNADLVDDTYSPGDLLTHREYGPDRGKVCHGVAHVDDIVGVVTRRDSEGLTINPLFMPPEQYWWFYVLKCADGTYYSGITVDPARRERVHNSGKGAKYLRPRKRRPAKLVHTERCSNRSNALKREAEFKKLTRAQKLRVIKKRHK